jgi:hypothetical protein
MLPALLDRVPPESAEVGAGQREAQAEQQESARQAGDSHLRSSREVIGYHLRTADRQSIGHVEDFLFDERDWSIQLLLIDTRNWWPGKHVLVSPKRVEEVDWAVKEVLVKVTHEELEASPEYDSLAPPGEGRPHDLYRHPGRPLDLP